MPAGREIVDDAFDKRHFRSDEHPIVTIVLHEIDERRMIGRVELRGADAVKLHARIAWGHSDLADAAATHERVGDGMFTRTGTNDQNLHISSCCIPYGEECQSQEIISGCLFGHPRMFVYCSSTSSPVFLTILPST